MTSRLRIAVYSMCALLLLAGMTLAQGGKPLTNDDVVAMVKGGLPEATVIKAIGAQPSNFDVSPAALIKLKQQGVSAKIIDAMLDAANKAAAPAPATAAAPSPTGTAMAKPAPGQPSVALTSEGAPQYLAISKTTIVQTKVKASSLSALAADSSVQTATNIGIGEAASHTGSWAGSTAVYQTGNVIGGLMNRKPTVTYVWAVGGDKADMAVPAGQPSFEVHFESIPGALPDDYQPTIVQLEPSGGSRLVGAAEGKQDVMSGTGADWQLYSQFIEMRVPTQATKVSTGVYKIQSENALPAGEYGVVLRPVNRNKKFVGSVMAQGSGDGLVFNSVWAFEVK